MKAIIIREDVRELTLRCSKCKQWKLDVGFNRAGDGSRRRGRNYFCKVCTNERRHNGAITFEQMWARVLKRHLERTG